MAFFWSLRLFFKNYFLIFLGILLLCFISSSAILSNEILKRNFVENQIDLVGDLPIEILWNNPQPEENIPEYINSQLSQFSLSSYLSPDFNFIKGWNVDSASILQEPNISMTHFFPPNFIAGVNQSLLDQLSSLDRFTGSLPSHVDDVVLIRSTNIDFDSYTWDSQIKIGNSVKVTLQHYNVSRNLKIVGIYSPIVDPLHSNYFKDKSHISSYYREFDCSDPFLVKNPVLQGGFWMNLSFFDDLFSNESYQFNFDQVYQFKFNLKNSLSFNSFYSFINNFNDFSAYMENLPVNIQRWTQIDYLGISSPLNPRYTRLDRTSLVEFADTINTIQFMDFWQYIFLIPSFFLALAFFFYSSQLLESFFKKEISLLQIRGISLKTITLDSTFFTIFFGLLGLITGIFISYLG
ncbi:MAG: hypothetical protein ACFFD1_12030, partial [Candidatus Thorarchaeota archaeon]